MLFTRNTKHGSQTNIKEKTLYNGFKFKKDNAILIKRKVEKEREVVPKIVPNKEEMTWGRATWFLFHTLAEKIKDEYFLQLKQELCNHIYRICNSLPCLLCQRHAVEYMRNINFDNIRTKKELKVMLFNFHNVVNKEKNYKQFSFAECDEKYKKANLIKIVDNFMGYMEKSRNRNDLHHTMYGLNMFNNFKLWIKEHVQYFNL